jgi:hypothetical protein
LKVVREKYQVTNKEENKQQMLERSGRKGWLIHPVGGNIISVAAMETSMEVPQKLMIEPSYPAVPLLGIYLKEYKSTSSWGTCTSIFITVLSVWVPSTDELIKKIWDTYTHIYVNLYMYKYIYKMQYYSAIKKHEIMLFIGKWMAHDKWNKPDRERQLIHMCLICGM